MNGWYDVACEIMLNWTIGTVCIIVAAVVIGYIIDKVKERNERRKIASENYIKYRIGRYIYKGY